VHCQGGTRSAIAASVLQAEGFTDVANVTGGIRAWEAAGFPVVTAEAAVVDQGAESSWNKIGTG
jgi:hydroxyacylglutathione hydrolase